MGRLGLKGQGLTFALEMIKAQRLPIQGLMSHLAMSSPDDPYTLDQIRQFKDILEELHSLGLPSPLAHLANSAGAILYPEARFGAVRPGLAIYGAYPHESCRPAISLRPAMRFISRIIEIKKLRPGEAVGYGLLFRASRPSKIAVVPVGYDNGYLRSLSGRGKAIVRGQVVSVVGSVCMKALFLDVSHLKEVDIGDEVLLLGESKKRSIRAEELAQAAGTIAYELFCLLGRLNQKVFIEG